ncbi:MAG: hypothetical protein AAFV86_13965 [Pseudomonadota bacterium]
MPHFRTWDHGTYRYGGAETDEALIFHEGDVPETGDGLMDSMMAEIAMPTRGLASQPRLIILDEPVSADGDPVPSFEFDGF